MDFDYQWFLLGLPLFFILGWLGSRFDLRQMKRETRESPKAYYKGLSLLLNEQQDKAIDAFIETVQNDPDTTELHFALGNLFRRRGEFERSVRVHQHLLVRADLSQAERERAQHALAQDFVKAGLFDRAEAAYKVLEGTAYHTEARLALLNLYERSRDWRAAVDTAQQLESAGTGSFARRISHYWCELALMAEEQHHPDEAERALQQALKADPSSARPWVMQGQRLARAGKPAEAFEAWNELRRRDPASFTLVANDYAAAAHRRRPRGRRQGRAREAAGRRAAPRLPQRLGQARGRPRGRRQPLPRDAARASDAVGRARGAAAARHRGLGQGRRARWPSSRWPTCAPPSRAPPSRCSAIAAPPAASRRSATSGNARAASAGTATPRCGSKNNDDPANTAAGRALGRSGAGRPSPRGIERRTRRTRGGHDAPHPVHEMGRQVRPRVRQPPLRDGAPPPARRLQVRLPDRLRRRHPQGSDAACPSPTSRCPTACPSAAGRS